MAYTIPDFGPSDLLSSAVEGERRIKVSTLSTIDTETLKGNTQAIADILSIPDGESVTYKINSPGGVFIKEFYADGLTVKYSKAATGDVSKLGNSNSLNLSKDSGFIAYYTRLDKSSVTDNEVVVAGDSPFSIGVFTDDEAYATITNNTGSHVSTEVSIILLPNGDFITPYGIKSDTQLEATTEMSNYD